MSKPTPDPVNAPPHYRKHPSGVECITVTEHFNFNRGNAIKYVWRAGEKGSELEDLKKARWYLDREIARVEALPKETTITVEINLIGPLKRLRKREVSP